MPRASAATSSRCPPTPASSSSRWRSRTSTASRACRRPSPSSRRPPRATRARPSARSPRSTTTCACCSPAIGQPHCPQLRPSRSPAQTVQQIVDQMLRRSSRARASCVLAPIVRGRKGEYEQAASSELRAEGFTRGQGRRRAARRSTRTIDLDKKYKHDIEVVVDRLVDEGRRCGGGWPTRVETALQLADGIVDVELAGRTTRARSPLARSSPASDCGITPARDRAAHLLASTPRTAPARPATASGSRSEIDPDLVVPDRRLSHRRGRHAPVGGQLAARLLRADARERRQDLRLRHWTCPGTSCPRTTATLFLYGTGKERIRSPTQHEGRMRHYDTSFEGIIAQPRAPLPRDRVRVHAREDRASTWQTVPCPDVQGRTAEARGARVNVGGTNIARGHRC